MASLATNIDGTPLKTNPKIHYIPPPMSTMQPVYVSDTNRNMNMEKVSSEQGFVSQKSYIKQIFLVTFGMILCGIPLAVISTLYAQQSSAVDTSNSTTTLASTTVSTMPSQCTSYITNTDSTRNIASGPGSTCDNTLASGWYRFMGGAGNYLATTYVNRDTCNTYYGGWFNGSLPSTVGATTFGNLCVNNNGYLCYAAWSGAVIVVTNCSGYYVYLLAPIVNSNCNSRYCTTN